VIKLSVIVATVLIPLQIVVGDAHGLNTLENQPAKLAAMEGIWHTQRGVPAVLFAFPDSKTQSNNWELSVPKLASLYLTHSWEGEVKGISEFGVEHPPVGPVFWAFRVMVGLGLLMLVVSWTITVRFIKGKVINKAVATALYVMTFSGWLALIAGWYVTEVGRQPWLVYGLLKTVDAASNITPANILLTLSAYLTLYVVLLGSYVAVVFQLAKKAVTKGDQYA